jgi:hypothetical protein
MEENETKTALPSGQGEPPLGVVSQLNRFGLVDKGDGRPGLVNYASDGAMIGRLDVAGTNVLVNGKYREHVARISRSDFGMMMFGTMPAYEGDLSGIVPDYVDVRSPVWSEFMATRKVVREPMDNGRGSYSVLPDYDLEEKAQYIKRSRKEKLYTMAQVFSDTFVKDKYRLSPKVISSVKTMAVSKPDEAARMLEKAMQELSGDQEVVVVAGPYSRSKTRAKHTVRSIAGKYPSRSAAVEAEVIGRKLLMFGPDGRDTWFVSGPINFSDEVSDVYRMVCGVGTSEPMFLLGMELTILGIDIYNGKVYECPAIEGHVGDGTSTFPSESSIETTEMLSVDARRDFMMMEDKVLPVTTSLGSVVGSSVRITARHVLVSEHVVQAVDDAVVAGSPVAVLRAIGRDILVARLDGAQVAWPHRRPSVGEMAVICYNTGNSVQYTSPMRVESADGVNILVTRSEDVIKSMSGGALVALSDRALLGVHYGATLRHNLCSQFGQEQYTDMCDTDAISQSSHSEADASAGDNEYDKFKKRGLSRVVDSVLGSLLPVYEGPLHLGMAVQTGDSIVTTVPVDKAVTRLGDKKIPVVYDPTGIPRQFAAKYSYPGTAVPMVFRNPEYYESVVVAGMDSEGPYFSEKVVVKSIGVSYSSFSISAMSVSDMPLVGGIVMAVADAAVLGQFVGTSSSIAAGESGFCVPLKLARTTYREDPSAALATMFPFLNCTVWPKELVEEVFAHSSVQSYTSGSRVNSGNLPLTAIGESAAKAALYSSLRMALVPYPLWQAELFKLQSKAMLAQLSWQHGYAKLLRFGKGASSPASGRAYSDLTEALLGAAYLQETPDNFIRLCEYLGVVPPEGTVTSSPNVG